MSSASSGETGLTVFASEFSKRVRYVWHDGRWFFSVVDVVGVLTDSTYPVRYWSDMKRRIYSEDFRELLSNCRQLKLPADDGKFRETDCADFATIVSLTQVLPALHRRATRAPLNENATASPCGIYAIINTCTNEQYIGSSGNILQRFARHKASLRRGQHHAPRLQEAWDSYGEAAFAFVVLEELPTSEHLEAREQQYLDAEQHAYNEATVARNNFSLPPISEERIQQLILSLYDIQCYTTPMPLFEALRTALRYGIVKPGPNFHFLVQAEAGGIDSWEALGSFLHQQQQAHRVGGAARRDVEARIGEPVVSSTNYKQLQQERQRELQPPLLDEPSGDQ